MINKARLTKIVKAKAGQMGFHLCGVASPDPVEHFGVYERWLAKGYHAEMSWMATERARLCRADPRQILPECRSILVLGVRYPASTLPTIQTDWEDTQSSNSPQDPSYRGQIASYAWGDDYHDVLPKRMRSLVTFIEDQIGHTIPNRWYTDTGPILERELGQRAGLGWIGKNSCLIHPRMGSYFLLAEIFLGLELEQDRPFIYDRCGSCTRCITACPTSCILPNRTLDARRCISYMTIELKSSIPADLRALMGGWIFGCDVCQQVCPWNQRHAPPQGDPAFNARPGVPEPVLQEELNLTPQAFNSKFKGSPIKRAKRRGYLRNIAVVLGNSGDPSAVPAIIKALKDDEPLVRGHAAWALRKIGGQSAHQALLDAAQNEMEPSVLADLCRGLER